MNKSRPIKKIDSSAKEEIRKLEKERQGLLQQLLDNRPIIEGSFYESLARCGRPNCHCLEKPAHLVTRISWYEKGKMKNKIVRIEDRNWVKQLVHNNKELKRAFKALEKINEKEIMALKGCLKRKAQKYK